MIWCNAVSLCFASVLNVFNMNSVFEQVECSEVLSYSCCTFHVKCTQVLSSLEFPFFQDWRFLYRETVDFCFCLTLKSFILFLSKCLVISPGGSEGKESACNAGGLRSILGLGRSPGGGNGNALQYSGLKNPMDRGASWATVYGVVKSQTWLSN